MRKFEAAIVRSARLAPTGDNGRRYVTRIALAFAPSAFCRQARATDASVPPPPPPPLPPGHGQGPQENRGVRNDGQDSSRRLLRPQRAGLVSDRRSRCHGNDLGLPDRLLLAVLAAPVRCERIR